MSLILYQFLGFYSLLAVLLRFPQFRNVWLPIPRWLLEKKYYAIYILMILVKIKKKT